MVNASNVLDNSGVFKPTKRANWSVQRSVPREILVARAEKEAADTIRANKEASLAKIHARHEKKTLGIHAKTVEGGFKIVGFGVTVATQDAVVSFALENQRDFVMIDGNKVA